MRIVMVCTGNVCRSPTAVELLRAGLIAIDGVSLASAGVAAVDGTPLCPEMGELLGSRVPTTARVDQRVSRLLSRAALQEADLVLAAQRSHCADIAQLVPLVRPRTFTLRAAAGLAAFVVDQLTVEPSESSVLVPGAPPLPPASDVGLRLRWLVNEMNESRGMAPPIPGSRRSLLHPSGRRNDAYDLDVPDPHAGSRVSHSRTFGLLERATDSLASSIRSLLEV